MFLDESGDHTLKTIDPNDPIFVLGGVIVERLCPDRLEQTSGAMTRQPDARMTEPLLDDHRPHSAL
jgi:hypothetical protein